VQGGCQCEFSCLQICLNFTPLLITTDTDKGLEIDQQSVVKVGNILNDFQIQIYIYVVHEILVVISTIKLYFILTLIKAQQL